MRARMSDGSSGPLEVLDRAFVLFGRFAGGKGAEVFSLACFGIHFSGIEPVFTSF